MAFFVVRNGEIPSWRLLVVCPALPWRDIVGQICRWPRDAPSVQRFALASFRLFDVVL